MGNAIGREVMEFAYRFEGKQRKLAIGPFPRVSLKDARARRDEAKRMLDDGLDPSQQKRLAKIAAAGQQANTFAAIADELLVQKRREGKATSTMAKLEWLLGLARPAIGARAISAIAAPEILHVLRGVEARERLETAHRLRAFVGSVFASPWRRDAPRAIRRSPPWRLITPTVVLARRSLTQQRSVNCFARSTAIKVCRKCAAPCSCSP